MASEPPAENFEELYQRLEETVARLEDGNLTLEESLALYEEGVKLARRCQAILKDAELRIARLQEAVRDELRSVGEAPAEYETRVTVEDEQ
jgi:exodeoxyribonuclease VII small subunit